MQKIDIKPINLQVISILHLIRKKLIQFFLSNVEKETQMFDHELSKSLIKSLF